MIFGVVGFIGSGKNTVGDILINDHLFVKESFAKAVKDSASSVFGWDRELLEGETEESRIFRETPDLWWENELDWKNSKFYSLFPSFTPRVALQLLGTEMFRHNFSDNIWISSLQKRLLPNTNYVITDCRFPNEINAIRKAGGKIIRVKRGPEPEWWDLADAANSDTFSHAPECAEELKKMGIHASEYSWVGQEFDFIIENNSTKENLKLLVNDIVSDHD